MSSRLMEVRSEYRLAWTLVVVAAACGGFLVPLGPVDLRPGRTLALRVAFAVSLAVAILAGVAWRRWRVAKGDHTPPARVLPALWLALAVFDAFIAVEVLSAEFRRPYLGLALVKLGIAAASFLDGRTFTASPSQERP